MDGDGVNFFFNMTDGTSSWDHPLDSYFRTMLGESLTSPKTVHADAGNAGRNMPLTDVAAAGCAADVAAPSTSSRGVIAAMRTAGAKRGVDTTAGQIMAYARHLGIDLIRDLDLLWIAEQALNAPTPVGWSEHAAADGTVYFSNQVTGLKTYTHPLDDHFKQLYRHSCEVKLLSSKSARTASTASQQPSRERPAVKVIESLDGRRVDRGTRRSDGDMRTFGTDLSPAVSSNASANQPTAGVVAVAVKTQALDRRERCVTPATTKNSESRGLPLNAEEVGLKANALVHDKENGPAVSAPSKESRIHHEDEELAEVMRLSAEIADKARLQRETEEREEAVVIASSIEEAKRADKARLRREADEENEAAVIVRSIEEADIRRQQEGFAFEEEQRATTRAAVASIADHKAAEDMKAQEMTCLAPEAEEAALEAKQEAAAIQLSIEEADTQRQRDAFAFDEYQTAMLNAVQASAAAEQTAKVEKMRVAVEEKEATRVAAEAEVAVHTKLFEEEKNAVARATLASLADHKAANELKAQELVPSLLFAGLC